jgi:nitrate/nitrite-specific signal transduction histidine kinase
MLKFGKTDPNYQPFSVEINGDRQFIQVTSLAEAIDLDWLIILVIPEADFMEKVYDNAQMTMLLSLAALGGALVVGLITSRWIVKPIALLNQAAHEMEKGKFQPKTLVGVLKRDDELGQLARVFQEMAVKIYNREQGMKKKMEQLRLEQDQAQEASMLALMSQKSSLQDLLTKAKKLHGKTAESQQVNLSDLLRKVKYFTNFSEPDIQQLINIGYQKLLSEGEYVCREDEPGDAFYIILTGNVEIYVEKINKFLTNLSDGTFFGELSLLLGIPRTATVRTTTDTLLFVVDHNGLQTLLQSYEELADQIAVELHKHKAELDERQEMLKNLGLIDDDDNSFNENPLSWIRKRITTLFGV